MADMEGCLPGGTRPNTPHHHMGLWLQATVQMRLCRGCAQGGVWWKRVGGRAGARQGRTAQNSGRMFVFAATLVPRRQDIQHENVGERENLNPRNHRENTILAQCGLWWFWSGAHGSILATCPSDYCMSFCVSLSPLPGNCPLYLSEGRDSCGD